MNRIQDILYVRFAVPDLGAQESFLQNFGLHTTRSGGTLYARGTDPDPYVYIAEEGDAAFTGIGFAATSEAALRDIAAIDQCAVTENSAPGGGLITRLSDPDGFSIDVVWGYESAAQLPVPTRSPLNNGQQQPRKGARVVFEAEPCTIKRLGHCVLAVTDFRKSEAWYKERFGLITSDEIYAGEEENTLGAFLRCDLGDQFVDHHTLFLLGAGSPAFNHAAFEIADWDSLMAGHFALQERGYAHSWGIGKHTLGSQVFDYWKDPHDFTLEHFTDGDLLNVDFGSHKASLDELLNTHWGPTGGPT